ncbi:MAG TPA: nucleotide exchange factor GrpE [Propionibacteriaceae bacterium]|nr:nucleotide exchange factor GrpE [Propionibacteriaceae bacterium]
MTTAPRPEPAEEKASAPEPEPNDEHTEESAATEVAADLDALLEDTKRERDQYLDLAQRAKADFENYRKRAAREAVDAERRGKLALARELVPSIDNLERALQASGIGPAEPAKADAVSEEVSAQEALARGVQLVHSELQAALARAGVEQFDPTGEKFDPNLHEAISTQPGENGVDSGTVIETLERGYRLDGQVLRPARVIVSE